MPSIGWFYYWKVLTWSTASVSVSTSWQFHISTNALVQSSAFIAKDGADIDWNKTNQKNEIFIYQKMRLSGTISDIYSVKIMAS
jgi:hypothetical protein